MRFYIHIYFTFMHLADAFIQSELKSTFRLYIYCQYVWSLGIEPTTFALLTQCSTTEPQEHVCVCVCVRVRACVRAWVYIY